MWITNTCLLQGDIHNGATNESKPLNSTKNARILEWRHWNVRNSNRIIQGNGRQTRSKCRRFFIILPQTRPLTSITSQDHEKAIEKYKSFICKTLKWTKIVEMKKTSWCRMCIGLYVFGYLIMVVWQVMHFKFSFKSWQMKIMTPWTIATKREP